MHEADKATRQAHRAAGQLEQAAQRLQGGLGNVTLLQQLQLQRPVHHRCEWPWLRQAHAAPAACVGAAPCRGMQAQCSGGMDSPGDLPHRHLAVCQRCPEGGIAVAVAVQARQGRQVGAAHRHSLLWPAGQPSERLTGSLQAGGPHMALAVASCGLCVCGLACFAKLAVCAWQSQALPALPAGMSEPSQSDSDDQPQEWERWNCHFDKEVQLELFGWVGRSPWQLPALLGRPLMLAQRRTTFRLLQDPGSHDLGSTVWDASIVLAKWLDKVT